ncbi:MAG: MBL fold metallo-hydrolase [Chloroflexi bacterium]|nr:MBL fold metallo-hydrolase [Chloroflexota bacterium]
MADYIRTFPLGAGTFTIINVGDGNRNMAGFLTAPESQWPPQAVAAFKEFTRLTYQAVHIAVDGLSVLVDPGKFEPSPEHDFPGYQPPPGLIASLAEIGVRPEKISYVIVTHAHGDHFNCTTEVRDGRLVPYFPNARHLMGRADWEQMQPALQNKDSLESQTLGVLHQAGLLDLVDSRINVSPGIQIIPTPGETPGHLVVRAHSQGQTLYCLGDLYHMAVEVEYPEWPVSWADMNTMRGSRQIVVEAALPENALLVATHIPGAGRLRRTVSGEVWVSQ